MTESEIDTSVVVVGAGQAGLSVAYYLRRLGLDPGNDFVLLDRGPGTGGAWQFRWESLRLGYAHRVHDLPGMDEIGVSFDTADKSVPAKDVVADYYARYEEHFGFHVVRPADVTSVEATPDGFAVAFEGSHGPREVSSLVVVNATGTWGSPFVPYYPGMNDFRGRHVHTTEYRDAEDFRGQDVVVVGGGTSAIGFLLELEEVAGSLTWVARRPIDFRDGQDLDIEGGQSAVAIQDEASRTGRALPSIVSSTGVPRSRRIQAAIERGLLHARPMFDRIEPDGVRWSNGAFRRTDAIIWATGFRPELRHLAPLKLREKTGGIAVGKNVAWKNPRVFFAGYGPTASTIGANRAGRSIARQVVAALSTLADSRRTSLPPRAEPSELPAGLPEARFLDA